MASAEEMWKISELAWHKLSVWKTDKLCTVNKCQNTGQTMDIFSWDVVLLIKKCAFDQ